VIVASAPERSLASPLGQLSPLTKLGLAVAWLVGLAVSVDVRPPLIVGLVAGVAGTVLGWIEPSRLLRAVAVLWFAAAGIGLFNALFSAANGDPAAADLVRLGPVRLTSPAALAGFAVGLRVMAIATVGVVFNLTTDSTRLVDALVQQARVPERFAYGALAAYQALPRLAQDVATLGQARRIRGLRARWHPRLLVGLLVLAIRHGDRVALAMDARAFGSGPRTRYREVRWTALDGIAALVGLAVLVVAVLVAR
jgi:energy-coupling factor transport system permease protein